MAFAPQAIFRKVPAARKVWKHKANPAILLHFLFLGVFCTTNIAIITFLCIAIELKKQAPWKFGRFKEALENMTSLSQCPGPCFHNIFPNYFRLPQFAAKKYNFIKHDIWTCHTVFQVDWPSHCSSQVLIYYQWNFKIFKLASIYCSWHRIYKFHSFFLCVKISSSVSFQLSLTAHLFGKISKIKWIKHDETTEFEYWIISSCVKNKESLRKERWTKIWKLGQI